MKELLLIFAVLIITALSFYSILNKQGTMQTKDLIKTIEENPGLIIDVRTRQEYLEGHLAITDAQIDMLTGEFQRQIPNMDKSKTYYLYCRSGNRSGQMEKLMRDQGFENVYNIGGFEELVRMGFEPSYGE